MDSDYKRYLELVEMHMVDILPDVDSKSLTLYESMKYSLTAGGKRLRPCLVMGACDFAGGQLQAALPYACAIEYVHTYSLIHDDLPCMDDDDYRRGRLTNHKVFGDDMATLAGDGLLTTAFEAMTKDMFLYFDNENELKKRVRAMYEIAKGAGCAGMLAGQVADVESEGKPGSAEMLDYIHINKTAAMIIAALRAGAHLGGADDNMLSDLTIYGEDLGLAFQIVDDILDIVGDAAELGKQTGMDEQRGKLTYPSIYGLDASYKRVEELTEHALDVMAPYYDNAEFFYNLVTELASRTK